MERKRGKDGNNAVPLYKKNPIPKVHKVKDSPPSLFIREQNIRDNSKIIERNKSQKADYNPPKKRPLRRATDTKANQLRKQKIEKVLKEKAEKEYEAEKAEQERQLRIKEQEQKISHTISLNQLVNKYSITASISKNSMIQHEREYQEWRLLKAQELRMRQSLVGKLTGERSSRCIENLLLLEEEKLRNEEKDKAEKENAEANLQSDDVNRSYETFVSDASGTVQSD